MLWNPRGDKWFGFQGTYTRATVYSNISFLTPQTLQPDWSRYRDNSHTIQGMFDLKTIEARYSRPDSLRVALSSFPLEPADKLFSTSRQIAYPVQPPYSVGFGMDVLRLRRDVLLLENLQDTH